PVAQAHRQRAHCRARYRHGRPARGGRGGLSRAAARARGRVDQARIRTAVHAGAQCGRGAEPGAAARAGVGLRLRGRHQCGRRVRRLSAPQAGSRRHPAPAAHRARGGVRPASAQVSSPEMRSHGSDQHGVDRHGVDQHGVDRHSRARPRRRRTFSLRTRVAGAAAAGAVILVLLVSAVAVRAIERINLQQSDQQLAVASRLVLIDPVIAVGVLGLTGLNDDMALSVRDDGELIASSPVRLPDLPVGSRTVTVDGTRYRVLTTTENQPAGRTVSLGIPADEAARVTAERQRRVLGGAVLAVAAAAALGWLFAGRAVRPIVDLTERVGARTAFGDPATAQPPVDGSGVREAEQLAEAVNTMLARVDRAQAETAAALATARDFAAVSAHELRTPLTAMRTDLEVLRTLDLTAEQRAEILDDLQSGQERVEATLSALERLATGDL